jgi:hypothetical protein
MPLEKHMWERTLPAVSQSYRKPVTIEESLLLGYRTKRLDMINVQEGSAVQSLSKEILVVENKGQT